MFGRSINIIVVSVIMAFLAAFATLLRFTAQRTRSRSRSTIPDDVLIVVGLLLSLAICVCNIVGAAAYRFGSHELYNDSGSEAGYPQAWLLLGYGKIFYALQILHCCAMPVIKGSFLIFLKNTFGVARRFRLALWTIGGYVFLWWFVTFWMTVFQCWPIAYNWGTSAAEMGSCIPNYVTWYAWMALLNVLSDIAITFLPLPEVWKLSMPVKKKAGASIALCTASLVIVAGIGRTVAYFEQGHRLNTDIDYTYDNYFYLIWTSVEPCLGVVSVCLPRLRPLVTVDGRRSIYASLRGSLRSLLRSSPRTTYEAQSEQSLRSQADRTRKASVQSNQILPHREDGIVPQISRRTDIDIYPDTIPLKNIDSLEGPLRRQSE